VTLPYLPSMSSVRQVNFVSSLYGMFSLLRVWEQTCKSKTKCFIDLFPFVFIHVFAPFQGCALAEGRDTGEQVILVMPVATDHYAKIVMKRPLCRV
jgi:hypothetical protein